MKYSALITSVLGMTILFANVQYARADWDPVLEAQEAAARKAAAQKEAQRKAEAEAMFKAAELKSQRQYLGAAANGMSDSEVPAAYARKYKQDQIDNAKKQQEAMALWNEGMKSAQASKPQTEKALKDITGKSLKDLENMSDEELDAMAAELEKKYGGAQ